MTSLGNFGRSVSDVGRVCPRNGSHTPGQCSSNLAPERGWTERLGQQPAPHAFWSDSADVERNLGSRRTVGQLLGQTPGQLRISRSLVISARHCAPAPGGVQCPFCVLDGATSVDAPGRRAQTRCPSAREIVFPRRGGIVAPLGHQSASRWPGPLASGSISELVVRACFLQTKRLQVWGSGWAAFEQPLRNL